MCVVFEPVCVWCLSRCVCVCGLFEPVLCVCVCVVFEPVCVVFEPVCVVFEPVCGCGLFEPVCVCVWCLSRRVCVCGV